jgi:hypothetical protein
MATIRPVPSSPAEAASRLGEAIYGHTRSSLNATLFDAMNRTVGGDRTGFAELAEQLRHLADVADVVANAPAHRSTDHEARA